MVGPETTPTCDIVADLYRPAGATAANPAPRSYHPLLRRLEERPGPGRDLPLTRRARLRRPCPTPPRLRRQRLPDQPRPTRTGTARPAASWSASSAAARRPRTVPGSTSYAGTPPAHDGKPYPDDPRVGMVGVSYGSGAAFTVAGSGPPRGHDHPDPVTWNDLPYSLAPNNTAPPADASQRHPGGLQEGRGPSCCSRSASAAASSALPVDPGRVDRLPELPAAGLPGAATRSPATATPARATGLPRARPWRPTCPIRSPRCSCRARPTPCSTCRKPCDLPGPAEAGHPGEDGLAVRGATAAASSTRWRASSACSRQAARSPTRASGSSPGSTTTCAARTLHRAGFAYFRRLGGLQRQLDAGLRHRGRLPGGATPKLYLSGGDDLVGSPAQVRVRPRVAPATGRSASPPATPRPPGVDGLSCPAACPAVRHGRHVRRVHERAAGRAHRRRRVAQLPPDRSPRRGRRGRRPAATPDSW